MAVSEVGKKTMEDAETYRKAVIAWHQSDDPQMMIGYLRGKLQESHEKYWDIKRENLLLVQENGLLRGQEMPDGVSWLMRKIDAQRREIVSLRERLGYKDRP